MNYNQPDKNGKFGKYGGRYVAETLMPAILELEQAYNKAKNDPSFLNDLQYYNKNFIGRPTPLYFAQKLTNKFNGAKIYLKRDELNHTGSHKINNCIGQILLAKKNG